MEQRDSEPCAVFKTRGQDDIHKRAGRTDKNQRKRNGMADDTPHRPRRGVCLKEIQRHIETESYGALHVQSGELFTDFHVTGKASVEQEIEEYIKFFNEKRPAYALGYMTPKQYREAYREDSYSKKTRKPVRE